MSRFVSLINTSNFIDSESIGHYLFFSDFVGFQDRLGAHLRQPPYKGSQPGDRGWNLGRNHTVQVSPAIGLTGNSGRMLQHFGYTREINGFVESFQAFRCTITRSIAILALIGVFGLAQKVDRPQWAAPPSAASRKNPIKDRPKLAGGGRKLFLKMCANCHASGPGQEGPVLSDQTVQQKTDGAIFWKIFTSNSQSGMPRYGSLPDGERWQLVLYIRNLVEHLKQ